MNEEEHSLVATVAVVSSPKRIICIGCKAIPAVESAPILRSSQPTPFRSQDDRYPPTHPEHDARRDNMFHPYEDKATSQMRLTSGNHFVPSVLSVRITKYQWRHGALVF